MPKVNVANNNQHKNETKDHYVVFDSYFSQLFYMYLSLMQF